MEQIAQSLMDGEEISPSEKELKADRAEEIINDVKGSLVAILAFLNVNNMSNPIASHMNAATSLSETICGLMRVVGMQGGSLESAEAGALTATELVAAQCEKTIPVEWFVALGVLQKTIEKFERLVCKAVGVELGFKWPTAVDLEVYKYQLFFYVLSIVGSQTFSLRQGPVVVQTPFLPPLVQTAVQNTLAALSSPTRRAELSKLYEEVRAWSSMSFQQVMVDWVGAAMECHNHCIANDCTRFNEKTRSETNWSRHTW